MQNMFSAFSEERRFQHFIHFAFLLRCKNERQYIFMLKPVHPVILCKFFWRTEFYIYLFAFICIFISWTGHLKLSLKNILFHFTIHNNILLPETFTCIKIMEFVGNTSEAVSNWIVFFILLKMFYIFSCNRLVSHDDNVWANVCWKLS